MWGTWKDAAHPQSSQLSWEKSWDVAKFIQKMIPLEKQPRSGFIPFGQGHGTA